MIDSSEIKDLDLFGKCTSDELRQLSRCMEKVWYKKNALIYMAEESAEAVFIILAGKVELYQFFEEQDRRIHLANLSAGDIFGIGEVYFHEYYISTMALEKCTLAKISKNDFLEYFMKIPSLNQFVVMSFAHIIRQKHMMQVWFSAKNMFEFFLFFLCREYGKEDGDMIQIEKRITQEEISLTINLSREHVSRLLRLFKKEKNVLIRCGYLLVAKEWYEDRKNDSQFTVSFRRNFNVIV